MNASILLKFEDVRHKKSQIRGMTHNCHVFVFHCSCNSSRLVFVFISAVILASLLLTTSGAPVNSIQEEQPWLLPCSHDGGASANLPVDIIRGVTVPRIPEWDDPSKFAFETLNVLDDAEGLVGDLTKYMVNYFNKLDL